MKYEQQLLFNAQSEWTNEYINYSSLKSAVYRFEKEALQARLTAEAANNDDETGALLGGEDGDIEHDGEAASAAGLTGSNRGASTSSAVLPPTSGSLTADRLSIKFKALCDAELDKIVKFYQQKEGELLDELDAVNDEARQVEEEGAFGDIADDSDADGESGDSGDEDVTPGTLLKKSTKAIKSAFGTSSSSTRRRSNSASRASSAQQHGRKRSMGSEASSGESTSGVAEFSGLVNTDSRGSGVSNSGDAAAQLPPETAAEIDRQLDRTAAAAAPALNHNQNTISPKPPLTPGLSAKSASRRRASSFGANSGDAVTDIWASNSRRAIDMRITFKLRLQQLFRELSQLKEYVNLNQTGFRKILKKFDKVTDSKLQKWYMSTIIAQSHPFHPDTQSKLDEGLQSVIPLYAKVATRGDTADALRQLQTQLREHVVWERNTIWRDMIGLERKGWSGAGRGSSVNSHGPKRGHASMDKPIVSQKEIEHESHDSAAVSTPLGRFRIPSWATKETLGGTVAVVAFISILTSGTFDRVEERNCLAILVLASIFWAMEVIPLFATSLLVPFLVVVLRVLRSMDGQDRRLTATEASKYIFSQMFTGTIVLLVGGFTLAGALSKQNIDKILASRVLSLAGTKPGAVLLAYMGVACFASMWISNVAAPVLCFSLIQPILRTLPPRSTYSKALVLGIALASNLGGMASPIASPQNLIAISYMSEPLSWAQWFAIALPVASISIVAIWALLSWLYGWSKDTYINPVKPAREKFTSTQWFVCAVTILTVGLLCIEHQLESVVGDMGIIALIPLVAFFGTGILRKADFDNFPWSIVFLAMGGIALGKGVLSSGLLADLDALIEEAVKGLDVWPILAIFSVLALVVATFVSHSIASVLIAPIAAQIGAALSPPHSTLLIMATALICSAGMGLPVSGFPNLMAVNLEDEVGNRYLSVNDFLKAGIPASFIATSVIITVGYVIMRLLGL